MKNIVKKKLFPIYIISYIGLTLLTFLTVVTLLTIYASNSLGGEINNSLEERLQPMADDLYSDFVSLKELTNTLSLAEELDPVNAFSTNISENYSTADLFRNNSTSVSFVSEFFLKYDGYDKLFLSTGYISYPNIYKTIEWNEESKAVFFNNLEEITIDQIITFNENTYVYVVPIQVARFTSRSTQGYFCFIIDKTELLAHIESRFGSDSISLGMMFGGELLVGSNSVLENENSIKVTNSTGDITLFMPSYTIDLAFSDFISTLSPLVIIVIFLILAFVGVALAYRSYTPIKKIASKYKESDAIGNELSVIDEILSDNKNRIEKQHQIIRRKLLSLIIYGDVSDDVFEQLAQYGVEQGNDIFHCIIVISDLSENQGAFFNDEHMQMIDDLSGEDCKVHTIKIDRYNRIICMLSFKTAYFKDELLELISELMIVQKIKHKSSVGGTYETLSFMQSSFLEATYNAGGLTDLSEQIVIKTRTKTEHDIVNVIHNFILKNDIDEAVTFICEYYNVDKFNSVSQLMKKYILADMSMMFTRICYLVNINVQYQDFSVLLCAYEKDTIIRETKLFIVRCIENTLISEKQELNPKMKEIVEFVKEHCCDNDISVTLLCDKFNLHKNTLTQMFKKELSTTYKDYIIKLRIEKSKKLLSDSCHTVAQISEQVGYANISSFIRLFKEMTGVTPNAYRNYISELN